MKKLFMLAAMTAFIGSYTSSFAQDEEKKVTKTEKKCDKKKKCCKKKCDKKKKK
ncbi:MAG: hypothetical protein WDZ35_14355 [Crocinitomicaceae bacterium]